MSSALVLTDALVQLRFTLPRSESGGGRSKVSDKTR